MGREKGEGARSKNRPSSSSLAASLLPSGTATVGFGGYVGSSRLDSSFPSEDANPFSDVDGEVAQHLKRLGRKDPTTKKIIDLFAIGDLVTKLPAAAEKPSNTLSFQLKALTSLSVLFKQKSGEDIVQIIPQWAFEYKRLLQDYNREVRRATHDTMTNLAITVGRGLAPHLKSLMGPWWLSQFDPVSEVSQAAKRSLQAAFSAQEKRLDALILCTSEIFLYLEENLKLTPQAMSDKAAPLDELEEMHLRVISSSLLALATLLDILFGMQFQRPGFENVTAEPKNASKARANAMSFAEKMFSTHKYFLEFHNSSRPAVRSATYTLLRSFSEHVPHAYNEENMKTLSSAILGAFQEKDPACHSSMWDLILLFSKRFPNGWTLINIQKTVLNRFWIFLRNGCYGSQQVSYPILVLFLDNIPPKAIAGDHFFLQFFQNLWAGRNPSHTSAADRQAFFLAFNECFLWVVHNASRYCTSVDAINHFEVSLVDNILVKILWHDYLLSIRPKDQDGVISGKSRALSEDYIQPLQERTTETLKIKYPMSYVQNLGKCIIEILSGISLKEHDLLSCFCARFQEDCLEMFQQAENLQRPSEHLERVMQFLLLLEQHAVQKGETWPLVYLAGPMVAKSFPLIRTLDSPDAVRLLTVTVSIFGPRKIVPHLFVRHEGHFDSHLSDDGDDKFDAEHFLQNLKENFIPWCFHGNNHSTSARLDLLLALIDDEFFAEQWCSIITFTTKLEEHSESEFDSLDFDRIDVLAMLMEKVRGEISKRKVGAKFNQQGSHLEHWYHKVLDSAAVSVARSSPPFQAPQARFLRAVLGGSTDDGQTSFLSRDAMFLIFEEVLKKFIPLFLESSFTWVRDASSLILSSGANLSVTRCESHSNTVEMVQFALDVLDGSFFCLRTFDEDCWMVPCILAAIFIIDWECSMISQVENQEENSMMSDSIVDGKSGEEPNTKLDFSESVHSFRCKISKQFWKSLGIHNLKRLKNILIQSIRSAVFKTDTLSTCKVASLCCQWMLEVLELLCRDQYDEQSLLDQLLGEGELWPLWVMPAFSAGKRSAILKVENTSINIHPSGHHQFVAFIDKLISELGISRVIAGTVSKTPPSLSEETENMLAISQSSYSRAWLAAEILCTWKWQGGSASGSFLPLLSEYAGLQNSSPGESLLDSIFSILLEGALVHGASGASSFFSVWAASDDEMERIGEPFLRALVSFLVTLTIKDGIWGKDKALVLFELLVDKLFIGATVSMNCLRILPFVMNVLIQPLRYRSTGFSESSKDTQLDSFEENQIHDTIENWFERTFSFPPLFSWQTGQGSEEWFQLIISCYPLSAIGGIGALKLALRRDISHLEKTLLLELFQKQRRDISNASASANQLPVVKMLLSKLTAISVGYCWKEFDEDDWEFVLSQLQGWIESAVVMMEEITENVDEAVMNISTSDNLEVTVKKLEQVVWVLDSQPMNIARNALYVFSLLCGIIELQEAEGTDTLISLKTEKWNPIKDQILEGVLRLFFATSVAEAIASSCCHDASSIIASTRLAHPHFWELVTSSVVNSSHHVRNRAVKSVELWGLSKGPISSLYAILFSLNPIPSLQFAAYIILSTEPISHLAITKEETAYCLEEDITGEQEFNHSLRLDSSSEENFHLREEISFMIEKLPSELLEMDLLAQHRVNVFIAMALLLSHLQSLPSSSPTRERLIQCIQDSANSTILDCLFQHIPLKLGMTQNLKKKDVELPAGVSEAAAAATRAITTGSVMFSVESLWPVGTEQMASLAGAVYGLMLRVLPAYVRSWFAGLRDRSTSYVIESFTKSWCSPPLLTDELSQIKKAGFADENFLVSVSKSAYEVVATYKKEETGMDLVIRLPASYPLRPVDVDCTRSLGISEVKQRKWLLSLTAFVRNQNGALAEAIRIWKSNFDKEFEGVEECPICYSIIHTTNHSLPRLACKTCKHKFHSACLYKWFSTSHKSNCPLCQSPF
ncbi:hypothetical protein HHK36_016074 [Tetracentron sinense]|uniref:E3 ubiquitin-protein ligase listerin n=1 Tax=Tetracentron sinense TaxID=13715 RepID=A0A834YZH2_TETSI|nr:hypothetical protein HHK36_016074 [Tetracentron sinense]